MLPIGLNQMTVPGASVWDFLSIASTLNCSGIELRNDLGRPFFDGENGTEFAALAANQGLEILVLAELSAFNEKTRGKLDQARALISAAVESCAGGVALIPAMANGPVDRSDQRSALRQALVLLQPILEHHGVRGLIEPLGFSNSSLRFKEDLVAVLGEMQRPDCFGLIHDTFHHRLAGGGPLYAGLTTIVHMSGVTDPARGVDQMCDADRGLVDARDRLGTIAQLRKLRAAGYTGPASFEVFAPEIHEMKDPTAALAGSIAFITSQLTEVPAGAA